MTYDSRRTMLLIAVSAWLPAVTGSTPLPIKALVNWSMRSSVGADSIVTDSPRRAEWKCSRLLSAVASKAMPIEPPRLRVMLNRLDADGMSRGAMPAIAKFDNVSMMKGWPRARTI